MWNQALIKKMLGFGYSFNQRIFVDAVKRASALGSTQQEHFHGFVRHLATATTVVRRRILANS
jgi:hypothetical protein